jgi:uncharacterized SAM-binding protein YcdF (DUF218 family)
MYSKKINRSAVIKFYLFIALSVCSVVVFLNSCMYSKKAARELLKESQLKVYDVIIVPGIPLEDGKWGKTMKGRIYWAKYLYDRGITKNIIFSGSAVYTPYYEGMVMSLYAEALGIPAGHVFAETSAEHSVENVYYSFVKAKALGFKKIALASDPFQTKSLSRFTRKRISKDVAMLPMVTDTLEMLEPTMIDPVLNFEKAYKKDFISIKEREGFFKRLRGTMGRNIEDSLSKLTAD